MLQLPLLEYKINLTPKTQQEVLDELGLSLNPSSTLAQLLSVLPKRQPSVMCVTAFDPRSLSRSPQEFPDWLMREGGGCLTHKLDQMLADKEKLSSP